ncbi:MAG: hypothetical protein ACO3JG_13540, partial [Luteolibacter sp.]
HAPQAFEFLAEWSPVSPIRCHFGAAFLFQEFLNGFDVFGKCGCHRRPVELDCGGLGGKQGGQLDENLRGTAFPQPEIDALRGGFGAILKPVGFDQSRKHRPVFRSLGLFRFYEIRQREEIRFEVVDGNGGASLPEFREWIDAAHDRHHIDSQAFDTGCLTTEMNRQATMEEGFLECGHCNHLGLQFVQRCLKAPQILRFGEDGEVHVAAKFRSAVKHARLAAHEQAADAMTTHRRKDCQCRVRVQESLQGIGRFPTSGLIPSSALAARGNTNPAIQAKCRASPSYLTNNMLMNGWKQVFESAEWEVKEGVGLWACWKDRAFGHFGRKPAMDGLMRTEVRAPFEVAAGGGACGLWRLQSASPRCRPWLRPFGGGTASGILKTQATPEQELPCGKNGAGAGLFKKK